MAHELRQSVPRSMLGGNFTCITAIMLFSFGFPAAELLLEDWGTVALIAVRNCLAFGLILALWPILDTWKNIRKAPWLTGIKIGVFGFGIGSALLLVTQSLTNTVTAALAAASMPIMAVLLEVILDGRELTRNFVLGAALALTGGIIATGLDLADTRLGVGVLLGFIATALFAWGSRATVKDLPGVSQYSQIVVTMAGMTVYAIVVYIAMLAFSHPATEAATQAATLDYKGWGLMLTYAWPGLAISQIYWISAVEKLGIGIASFHLNATPFYVMIILLAMGGTWSWTQAFGATLLAFGVIVAQRP